MWQKGVAVSELGDGVAGLEGIFQSLSPATPGCLSAQGKGGPNDGHGVTTIRDFTKRVPLHEFVSRTLQVSAWVCILCRPGVSLGA